jgi:ABC-2 type transport system ATP-binding protein
MSSVVIETHELTKKYGSFRAVRDLNLTVQQGEVFGLLGPNGAGKTTTLLMLLGLTEPSGGSVRVLGLDPARQPLKVKARVGYMPDSVGFYGELTAWENLNYIARLNGIPRKEADKAIESALERVGLKDIAEKPVGNYSHGMRQRLGVADVLVKSPQVIIMDEPTQGLDPEGAREFLHLIRGLKAEGITILLSSHLLHQVQAICDRVGLFSRGEMVLVGSVPELARKVLGRAYRVYLEIAGDPQTILLALQNVPGALQARQTDDMKYEVEAEHDVRADTARAVVQAGGDLLKLDVETQSLDEIYAHFFKEFADAKARAR